MKLSIVVTAFTTERIEDIYAMLDSIKAQTYPDIDTVFIIERSAELLDMVSTYVGEKGIAPVNVIFSEDKLGLSGARNLGIDHAGGDIIAFIDDDVVLFPYWAENMVNAYHDSSIIGVTGPGLPLWETDELKWLPEEMYWIVSTTAFTGWDREKSVRSAWGMNMSFRREAFGHCRFSTNFGQTSGGKEAWKAGPVDDAEFSINLRMLTKKDIMYNPDVKVYHRVYTYRLSDKFVKGQSYWQGYSKALLKKMYPNDMDTKNLVKEFDLLKRIVFGLIPRSIAGLVTSPGLSWKRLKLTTRVLWYVALGYSAVVAPRLMGFTKRYFKS